MDGRSNKTAGDASAVGGAAARDFEAFFAKAFPRAVAAAQRVTANRPSAEDAAIAALAKAHFRWRRVGDKPWRDAWVLKVAVNEALRRLPKACELPTPATPPDLAEVVALRQSLVAAMDRLPRRQREVIALRYLVGLSEPDVATALNVSLGTVKTHLRRGMGFLRSEIGTSFKEDYFARLA